MCYFSMEGRSRPAKEEDVLVVSKSPHGMNWLLSSDDGFTPVCLKEGTKVELLFIPQEIQKKFGLPSEVQATFSMKHWWWRRDCFVLKNKQIVKFNKLLPGQVVRVLSVPGVEIMNDLTPETELVARKDGR